MWKLRSVLLCEAAIRAIDITENDVAAAIAA
jgi:hypothetical protein